MILNLERRHTTPKASRRRVYAGSVRLPLSLSCLTRFLFGGGVDSRFTGCFCDWRERSGDTGAWERAVVFRERVGDTV